MLSLLAAADAGWGGGQPLTPLGDLLAGQLMQHNLGDWVAVDVAGKASSGFGIVLGVVLAGFLYRDGLT